MTTEIIFPAMGESIKEGIIGQWLINIGDSVNKGDEIVEIETAKATIPVESPVCGVLIAILVDKGSIVKIGHKIAVIGEEGETWQNNNKPGNQSVNRISPNARRIAREAGIDVRKVQASLSKHVISGDDVKNYLLKDKTKFETEIPQRRVALNPLKKIAALKMLESTQNIPQFSVSMDIDVTDLMKLKNDINKKNRDTNKYLKLTPFFIYTAVKALQKNLLLNSMYDSTSQEIIIFDTINLSIAVATQEGVRVPVIYSVEGMSIDEIDKRLGQLLSSAHDNKLGANEVENATFTISNLGMYGVNSFVPLINPPQVAILGIGAVREEYISSSLDESKETLTMLQKSNFTVNADHRVLDGVDVAKFLLRLKDEIKAFYG